MPKTDLFLWVEAKKAKAFLPKFSSVSLSTRKDRLETVNCQYPSSVGSNIPSHNSPPSHLSYCPPATAPFLYFVAYPSFFFCVLDRFSLPLPSPCHSSSDKHRLSSKSISVIMVRSSFWNEEVKERRGQQQTTYT